MARPKPYTPASPITTPLLALALPLDQPYPYKVTKLSGCGRCSPRTSPDTRLPRSGLVQQTLLRHLWFGSTHVPTPTLPPYALTIPSLWLSLCPPHVHPYQVLSPHLLMLACPLPHPTLPPAALTKPPSFGSPPIQPPGAFTTPLALVPSSSSSPHPRPSNLDTPTYRFHHAPRAAPLLWLRPCPAPHVPASRTHTRQRSSSGFG